MCVFVCVCEGERGEKSVYECENEIVIERGGRSEGNTEDGIKLHRCVR